VGAVRDHIDEALAAWIAAQAMFVVSTAPLSSDGHVNCSPKGMDCLRVLDKQRVAWVDLTGSGVETIAHLRENGRITLMWCAFVGGPQIVRIQGRGRVHRPGEPGFVDLAARLPQLAGTRSIIEVIAERISSSCGMAVPLYDFVGHRHELVDWATTQGEVKITAYQQQKNRRSIDGLPGL